MTTAQGTLTEVTSALGNVTGMLDRAQTQPGGVLTLVDPDGAIYAQLMGALESVNGTLGSVNKIAGSLPAQMPQIGALLSQVRGILITVNDLLVSLTNNPLLKGGVPTQVETDTTGTSGRQGVAF
jgi:phospholipid/cholesterol/gamma-HCH transport system substrate-binding protein